MSNELEVEELAAMVTDMLNAMLFFAGVKKENLEAASKAYIKEIDFFFENEESDEEMWVDEIIGVVSQLKKRKPELFN